MDPLKVGSPAPVFALPASNDTRISLLDYSGKKYVVLYFYPKDMTPGCTQEAVSFRDLQNEFDLAGAVIIGVSTDDAASHSRFALQYNLSFPLLSDSDGKIAAKYGVLNQPGSADASPRARRTTFVIDKAGTIVKTYMNVKVECHADEILAFLHGVSLNHSAEQK